MKLWTRAVGLWQSGGGSGETLEITLPPASWDLSEGAVRQGVAGSTLAGVHILIPGTGATPSRYLWFSHDDGTGRFVGSNPGSWVPALAALTGIEVQLPAGNSPDTAVAALAQTALGAFPADYSLSLAGAVLSVTGDIDAAAASTGDDWATRGNAADIGPGITWGFLHSSPVAAFAGFGVTEARAARLDPAEVPSGLFRIIGVQVSQDAVTADRMRLALYTGGASDTDPTGATLLVDFGQTQPGPAGWFTIMCTPSQIVQIDGSAAPRIWAAFKGTANTFINAAGTGTGFAGNFATSPGIFRSNSMNSVPGTAWAASWSAGTPGNFANIPAIRLIVQRVNAGGSYSSNGQWFRRYGTNNDNVAAFPNQIPIDVLVGMSMQSAPVLAQTMDYCEVAYRSTNAAGLFRLGIYTGGPMNGVGAPSGTPLLVDLGITPNPGANAYARITPTPGTIAIPPSTTLRPFFRDESNLSQVAFETSPTTVYATVENPAPGITVEGGQEYEVTASNPSMSIDNNVPYENPFITDASDILPNNNVPLRIAASVPGIGLVAA